MSNEKLSHVRYRLVSPRKTLLRMLFLVVAGVLIFSIYWFGVARPIDVIVELPYVPASANWEQITPLGYADRQSWFVRRQEGSCDLAYCGSVQQVHAEIAAALSAQGWSPNQQNLGMNCYHLPERDFLPYGTSGYLEYIPANQPDSYTCIPNTICVAVWMPEASQEVRIVVETITMALLPNLLNCSGL